MKTYEESLEITVAAVREDGGDYRTAYRYGAYSVLANIYNVDIKNVYEDASKLELAYNHQQNVERREAMRFANEQRRLANLASGVKKDRDPKQYKINWS